MNVKLFLLMMASLVAGLWVGAGIEHESMIADYAKAAIYSSTHASDVQTIIGIEHCADPGFGYLSIDRTGHVTPHLDMIDLDTLNAVMDKAPHTGALRVCTVEEKARIGI